MQPDLDGEPLPTAWPGYDRLQARDVYMDAHALKLNTTSVVRGNEATSTHERPAKRQKHERRKGTLGTC